MKRFKKFIALVLMIIMVLAISRVSIVSAKDNEDYTNGPNIEIKNLTKIQEETLFKLCKVWGFVKYYHTEVASGKLDWDAELFKVMPKLLNVKDSKEADKIIYDWIKALGKLEKGQDINWGLEVKLAPNTEWIKDSKFLSLDLNNLLVEIQNCKKSETHHYLNYDEGAANPVFLNEKKYEKMSYSDDGVKLLGLFRYWNMIEYFSPNRHLIEENWDSVLKEFITKMVNEDTELGYKLNLYELIGKIKDGHNFIVNTGKVMVEFEGENIAPFKLDFIEGKMVVVKTLKELSDLKVKIGDVILKIDGKNVEDLIKEKSKYYAATSSNYINKEIPSLLARTNKTYLDLTIERDNVVIEERVSCSQDNFKIYDRDKNVPSHTIKDNILYINPSRLAKDEIHDIMKKSMDTKGLIVDLRYYPSDLLPYKLGNYLMPNPVEFVKFSFFNIYKPGGFLLGKSVKTGVDNPNYYKGKVILLISETSMSQPEFTTMALRKAPKATVVGTNSYGADGNISEIVLPGGIITYISGLGVYYPDGAETQKIGIAPDVRVNPTIKGIKEGRDEVIEKAIEIINQ